MSIFEELGGFVRNMRREPPISSEQSHLLLNDVRSSLYDILTFNPYDPDESPIRSNPTYIFRLHPDLQKIMNRFQHDTGYNPITNQSKVFVDPAQAAQKAEQSLLRLLPADSRLVHQHAVVTRAFNYWGNIADKLPNFAPTESILYISEKLRNLETQMWDLNTQMQK